MSMLFVLQPTLIWRVFVHKLELSFGLINLWRCEWTPKLPRGNVSHELW